MTYIENIFVCMIAPPLIAVFCAGKRRRSSFLFVIAGMGTCLLSAYINTFFARLYGADVITATVEIAPVVEEIMKLLPLLFYLLIFEPGRAHAHSAILIIAVSFATFENVCYLTENGAAELSHLLIRGFGTGAMHIVCGTIVGGGLLYVWRQPLLKAAGTFGLLCVAISYHAIYNLLLSAGGPLQIAAYLVPVATVLIGLITVNLIRAKRSKQAAAAGQHV